MAADNASAGENAGEGAEEQEVEEDDSNLVDGLYGQTQADPEIDDWEDTCKKVSLALEHHKEGLALHERVL
jgi:hypothetical protein